MYSLPNNAQGGVNGAGPSGAGFEGMGRDKHLSPSLREDGKEDPGRKRAAHLRMRQPGIVCQRVFRNPETFQQIIRFFIPCPC